MARSDSYFYGPHAGVETVLASPGDEVDDETLEAWGTDPAIRRRLAPGMAPAGVAQELEVDLEALTVADLKALAADAGLDYPANAKKADLVELVSTIEATTTNPGTENPSEETNP